MPDRLQVHPDLVGSSGARHGLEQRGAVRAAPEPRTLSLPLGPSLWSTTIRSARLPRGASTANVSCSTEPRTSARYRRSTSWRRIMAASASWASSVFATSMSPDVPASRRCTMPGRSSPPALDSGIPIPSRRFTSVPRPPLRGGMGDHTGRLGDDEQVVVDEANRDGRTFVVPFGQQRLVGRRPRPRCVRPPAAGTTSIGPPRRRAGVPSMIARCTSARGRPERRATTASSRPASAM